MEKYGVDTGTDAGEKTANSSATCPVCGMELDKNTSTPRCPIHGTEPFEQKPEE